MPIEWGYGDEDPVHDRNTDGGDSAQGMRRAIGARMSPSANPSPHARRYPTDAAATCIAARQVLLSQGYGLTEESNYSIKGSKAYQPDDDEHLTLELTVVCMDRKNGGSMAYANAVQTVLCAQGQQFGTPA